MLGDREFALIVVAMVVNTKCSVKKKIEILNLMFWFPLLKYAMTTQSLN